jgi:hypothetical protein
MNKHYNEILEKSMFEALKIIAEKTKNETKNIKKQNEMGSN